jgi:hypothetical protein
MSRAIPLSKTSPIYKKVVETLKKESPEDLSYFLKDSQVYINPDHIIFKES